HVVNLREGLFSADGAFTSTKADVDLIFDYHLSRAVAMAKSRPDADGGRLRIVVWAHGGLNDEATGLRIALRQIEWWKKNQIYPLFFVWETGFWDAIEQLLRGARPRVSRDLADWTTDPVIETLAGVLTKVWTAMKVSAARASASGCGARYVADRLAAFATQHAPPVELHAVGHSAGAIFHSYFLPALLHNQSCQVESLQLLAPAIRVDEFTERLAPLVDTRVRHLTMYTMTRDYERADS